TKQKSVMDFTDKEHFKAATRDSTTESSNSSAHIAGHPRANTWSSLKSEAETLSASSSCASPPADSIPLAIASAIASVFPVLLQYTTLILLMLKSSLHSVLLTGPQASVFLPCHNFGKAVLLSPRLRILSITRNKGNFSLCS